MWCTHVIHTTRWGVCAVYSLQKTDTETQMSSGTTGERINVCFPSKSWLELADACNYAARDPCVGKTSMQIKPLCRYSSKY